MKIPFYRPDVSKKELSKVEKVLHGEAEGVVEDFETKFEDYIGCGHALSTSHGTAALHLAMLAIDLKRGDKVLCSVNAFPSVPEVVRHFDAEPVFIDVDEWTYNMDIDKLEHYLEEHSNKKLKAVIATHIAGQPMDLERLYNIAKIYDVKIIEDASAALGATYNSRKIGSTGADITCFSFSPHMKLTISNGGVLATDDLEMMERASLLRNHGIVKEEESLSYIYDVVEIGNKYTMSPLEAAFNTAFIAHQDMAIERQQELAARYNERLKGTHHITLPEVHRDHAFFNYIIKVDKNRDGFARDLLARGIETGLHYIPLHLMSYYKNKYGLRINDFPVALRNYQQILSLPIYAAMTDKEVDYVCDNIIELAKNRV